MTANFPDSDFLGPIAGENGLSVNISVGFRAATSWSPPAVRRAADGDDEGTVAFDPNDREASLAVLQSVHPIHSCTTIAPCCQPATLLPGVIKGDRLYLGLPHIFDVHKTVVVRV
jgi:hypothetical protein